MQSVRVALEPDLEPRSDRSGHWPRDARSVSAVVIDVLRATTTLTVAFANGARRVIPLSNPADAIELKARDPDVLVGGERKGLILPGFDLGNSPLEYTRERVAGRTIGFASTNGSLAMRAVAHCGRRRLGAFVNAAAVVESLVSERFVLIVCAGNLGRVALEDAACAGLLCARLAQRGATLEGPEARLVASLAPGDATQTRALLEGSEHGRYLRRLGKSFARDVEFCAALDSLDFVFEI